MEARAASPIFTLGHSTRTLVAFVEILKGVGVERLVDVRTVPRSTYNPQFNGDALSASLRLEGIEYFHAPPLGGLRRPQKDSTNVSWRNASFRGYADHMESPEFAHALEELIGRSRDVPTVVMCAEAVPWRCHRWLIADALVVRGIPASHLMKVGTATPHRLTGWAVIRAGRPTYPAATARSTLDDFESPDPPARNAPARRRPRLKSGGRISGASEPPSGRPDG